MIPDDPTPDPDVSNVWFFIACVFEGGLLLVAWIVAALTATPLFADFHWDGMDALKGIAAALPPALFFVWSMNSDWRPLHRIHQALEEFARPIFGDFSIPQLLAVSLIAGIGEEVLFRSVIQGGLSSAAGAIVALVIASVLFGIVHLVTVGYAVGAAVMGGYLGWIWLQGGNLLIPIVTHAVYDFIALAWFIRNTPPVKWEPPEDDEKEEPDKG